MPPHSLTMTMIGASLLWVGWFGFNAGSNLEANGVTALAFVNTMVATAGAALVLAAGGMGDQGQALAARPGLGRRRRSRRRHPGLRLRRPDGLDRARPRWSAPICLFFVSTVKNALGYDDALDVFGVHCIGGIIGAIATGILVEPGARRRRPDRLHQHRRRQRPTAAFDMWPAGASSRRQGRGHDPGLVGHRLGDPLQDRRLIVGLRPAPDAGARRPRRHRPRRARLQLLIPPGIIEAAGRPAAFLLAVRAMPSIIALRRRRTRQDRRTRGISQRHSHKIRRAGQGVRICR